MPKKKNKKSKKSIIVCSSPIVKDTKQGLIQNIPHAKIMCSKKEMYIGPIPHPLILKQYNEICNGSAKTIIEQFQKQSDHRMELEKQVIMGNQRRAYLGTICGLIISVLGLSLSGFLIYNDKTIGGTALAGTTLVSLVYVFVKGKKIQAKELSEKR